MPKLIPPFLKDNSTIGICCPGAYVSLDDILHTLALLEQQGWSIKLGKTISETKSQNYFSGTDEERLLDLQLMLDDDSIDCILFGRGGYGLSRIIDRIDWNNFLKKPKWICGFSDITLLHTHINSNFNVCTLHSPMAKSLSNNGTASLFVQQFINTLKGNKAQIMPGVFNELNKTKNEIIKAEIIGGNLSLLVHSIGSKSELKTDNKILFIEDIDEPIYAIDRMLLQLKRAKKMDNLKGLIVGGFTNSKDTMRPFGMCLEEIILDHCSAFNFPILFDMQLGHQEKNMSIIIGNYYNLYVQRDNCFMSTSR